MRLAATFSLYICNPTEQRRVKYREPPYIDVVTRIQMSLITDLCVFEMFEPQPVARVLGFRLHCNEVFGGSFPDVRLWLGDYPCATPGAFVASKHAVLPLVLASWA